MGHAESVLKGPEEAKVKAMLANGQDPKDYLIEYCRPECKKWEDKLRRCESTLKNMSNADPEMTCMYPLRDWVTCVDGCVQPKIHSYLAGNEHGKLF